MNEDHSFTSAKGSELCHSLLSIIDDLKDKIPLGEYIKICDIARSQHQEYTRAEQVVSRLKNRCKSLKARLIWTHEKVGRELERHAKWEQERQTLIQERNQAREERKQVEAERRHVEKERERERTVSGASGPSKVGLCFCGKKRPSFGYRGGLATHCNSCRQVGMVDVRNLRAQ